MDAHNEKQSTPPDVLMAYLMSPSGSKTEAEHFAAREIDLLRAELEALQSGLKDPVTVLVNIMRGHIANPHADTAKRNDELCAENESLTAELTEARRLLDEARRQEPVAWAYCFSIPKRHDDTHDNDEFSEVVYRTHRELSADAPFGRRGYDFDESADTTETPLYERAPVQHNAVPQVTDAMVSAALCSQARDDEGEFPVMIDLLDFSGENKSRTAMRHALECALLYAPDVKDSLTPAAAPVPAQPAAVPAEVARAVQILRKHNEWRRGADNNHWQATPYSPAGLGRAIDAVCDHVSHSAQPDVLRRATEYAHDIVTWLHRDHYADNTTFEPFGDLLGLLSQIDNMICGWKEPQPAVPDDVAKDAVEIVAYRIYYHDGAKRLTEDGEVYEHEKRAGLKIDWLGVVGGIDAAILSATDTEQVTCDDCNGEGFIECLKNCCSGDVCDTCRGTGVQPKTATDTEGRKDGP